MAKKIGVDDLLGDKLSPELIAGLKFEDGLKLLADLVARVESGDLPLDQSVRAYEKGVGLVAQLQKHLNGAEQRLKVLQKSATVGEEVDL